MRFQDHKRLEPCGRLPLLALRFLSVVTADAPDLYGSKAWMSCVDNVVCAGTTTLRWDSEGSIVVFFDGVRSSRHEIYHCTSGQDREKPGSALAARYDGVWVRSPYHQSLRANVGGYWAADVRPGALLLALLLAWRKVGKVDASTRPQEASPFAVLSMSGMSCGSLRLFPVGAQLIC